MVTLILPLPPSINCLYAGTRRRYKSKKYDSWEIAARSALRGQPFEPFDKIPLLAHYRFGRPNMRTRDLGNLEKALSDFLKKEGVILDDCWLHKIILEWDDVVGVHATISTLP